MTATIKTYIIVSHIMYCMLCSSNVWDRGRNEWAKKQKSKKEMNKIIKSLANECAVDNKPISKPKQL